MKLEEVKVGEKYRISFQDGDKTVTVYARVTGNDLKKKILKFVAKDNLYAGRWDEFTVQSLTGFLLKGTLRFLTGSTPWYNKPFWGWLVVGLILLMGGSVTGKETCFLNDCFISFLISLCLPGVLFLVQMVPFIRDIWKDRFGWRFWGKIGLIVIGLTIVLLPFILLGSSVLYSALHKSIPTFILKFTYIFRDDTLAVIIISVGLWAVLACFSSRIRQTVWQWVVFCILSFCVFSDFIHYITRDVGQSAYDKPIIYLYPEAVTDVVVELGYPDKTMHTYPKYQGPWQVQAAPNGDLTDLKTGRHYYALYWEGENTVSTPDFQEGFVVAGSDTIAFLEEKLAELGLTEREAEEFIVYWLPKLESAPYNLIRFQTVAEQNENMPLGITPAPETLIRVMMEYRNLEQPVQVPEQILPETPQRKGFTVVEWGGTEL